MPRFIDQATMTGLDGETLYRWFVWLGREKNPRVTWAVSEEAVRQQHRKRKVRDVEPAPSIEDQVAGLKYGDLLY